MDVTTEKEGSGHLLCCHQCRLTVVKHWLVSLSLIHNVMTDAEVMLTESFNCTPLSLTSRNLQVTSVQAPHLR